MFDLDEINLDPNGPTSKATKTASGNAISTAKALLRNQKFYCPRIKAEVLPRNCKGKYNYAKAQSLTMSPCLECAKVLAMLRKEPSAEPQPTIDPKELAAMARPTKKGTPDQIQQEAKPEPTPDNLSGLTLYSPKKLRIDAQAKTAPYVFLAKSCLTFSASAVSRFDMNKVKSISVFHDGTPGNITRLVFHLGGAVMKLSASGAGSIARKISSHGLVKNLKLGAHVGRRYSIQEIAPGYLEIQLDEVAA